MNVDEIKSLNDCTKCPYNTFQPVGSYCKTDKPLFVVLGQSPGKDEVDAGEPFVGPSGKLLQKMLGQIQLSKSQLYITNAIKCMPTNNKEPTRESLDACRPALVEELKAILPTCQHKLILVVGKVALKQIDMELGKKSIDTVVGSLIHNEEFDCDIFIIRHPAALLRSNSMALQLQYNAHFEKLRNYLSNSLTKYQLNDYTLIDTEEELDKILPIIKGYDKPMSLDIETTSLKMWEAKILSIAIYSPDFVYVINTQKVDPTKFLSEVKDQKWIFHNAEFDIKMIDYIYNVRLNLFWDTMQVEHVLDEEGELGLKTLAIKYFNAPPYDAAISKLWNDTPELLRRLEENSDEAKEFYLYNARDTYYTYLLYENQVERFKQEQPSYKFYEEFTLPLSNTFLDIVKYGIPIDTSKLIDVETQLLNEIKGFQQELFTITKTEFNHRSLPMLLSILTQFGLDATQLKKTEKGAPSLTKDSLEELARQDNTLGKIATLILNIRKNEKLITTYVHQIKEYIYENKYSSEIYGKPLTVVSPSFKMHASKTYRINNQEPNITNINRGSIIRTLFSTPEGYTYFGADYKNAEAYLCAVISKEQKVIDFILNPDKDQHRYTASLVYHKPESEITKEERSHAKLAWFALQYGGTEHALMRDFDLTLQEALSLVNGIKQAYPKLFGYQEALKQYAKQKKRLVNRWGATKRFLIWQSVAERQAINFPFQSEVSIYNHLSFRDLHNISKYVGLNKFRVLFTIHDSIDGIIRDDLIVPVGALIKKVMTLPRKGMQLIVDLELGKESWLNLSSPSEEIEAQIKEYEEKSIDQLIEIIKSAN